MSHKKLVSLVEIPTPLAILVSDWRSRLGYPSFAMDKKTMENTTNMVKTLETETREYMRDHYKTRVWDLHPKHINDTYYSDTYFSGTKSIRGFRYFRCLHSKKHPMSKFD